MAIEVIMEKEQAQEVYDEICKKLDVIDLDTICGDEDEQALKMKEKMIQAIRCGLVYFDNDKNCLIQKLIKPLESGGITKEYLEYRNRLTLKSMHKVNEANGMKSLQEMLAQVTGAGYNILNWITGEDFRIAQSCLGFYNK